MEPSYEKEKSLEEVRENVLLLIDTKGFTIDETTLLLIKTINYCVMKNNTEFAYEIIDKLVPILDYNLDKVLIELSIKLDDKLISQKILEYLLKHTNADIRYNRCSCIVQALKRKKSLLMSAYINHLRNSNYEINEKLRILNILLVVANYFNKKGPFNKDLDAEIEYLNKNVKFYNDMHNKN